MFNRQSFTHTFYQTCVRGFQQMSPEAQECLTQSVAANQGPDGFFCGRVSCGRGDTGQEDLYYSFFGLLLAAVTGAKIRNKECLAKFASVDFASLDLVHSCTWLRMTKLFVWLGLPQFLRKYVPASSMQSLDKSFMPRLQSLPQLPPRAYPQHDADSPYSRFLLGTLHTDFGQAMPECDLNAYRLPNGLYANLKHHGEYGVNATAAALFLLPPDQCGETADALLALQEPDGSYKAAASAPEGDLMSTATVAFALQRCGKSLRISPKPFLRECFRDNGLFAATPLDPDSDLEYTAYGLLLMGLLT